MSTTNGDNGLVIKTSTFDFETTYDKLKTSLNNNPNLKVILELDHSANAASKNLKLRPTKIIVFGNPALGTPLMDNAPTLAIDLPQKLLVYQENNTVKVAYNNPAYLKNRHEITDNEDILSKISTVLDKITNITTGNS